VRIEYGNVDIGFEKYVCVNMNMGMWIWFGEICVCEYEYRVAKTHRIP